MAASRRGSVLTAGGRSLGGGTPGAVDGLAGRGRFVLVVEHSSLRHRGIDLADVVEGLGELHLEEGLAMNPDDLARLGVEPGGAVTVGLDGIDLVRAARPDPDCPRGAAYLVCDEAWEGPSQPVRVTHPGRRARSRASRAAPRRAHRRRRRGAPRKGGGRGPGR